MNATHIHLFNLEKANKAFFLYYICCTENKFWKCFKIMRNFLFNYSFYSHLEINYGTTADESSWAGAELANPVPSRQKGRAGELHFQTKLFCKKSRNDLKVRAARGALCMADWAVHIREMELMMGRDEGVRPEERPAVKDAIWVNV
jgi:hypothetical protein